MIGKLISFLIQWDEGNVGIPKKCCLGRHECEQMISVLIAHSGSQAVWIDIAGSKKERVGQRFVAVVSKPNGKRFFICFTVRNTDMGRAVRIIRIRIANRREPLCWSTSKRYLPAPPLHQLLGA